MNAGLFGFGMIAVFVFVMLVYTYWNSRKKMLDIL